MDAHPIIIMRYGDLAHLKAIWRSAQALGFMRWGNGEMYATFETGWAHLEHTVTRSPKRIFVCLNGGSVTLYDASQAAATIRNGSHHVNSWAQASTLLPQAKRPV